MAQIPTYSEMPNFQRPMTLVMPLADPSYAGLLALGQAGFGPTAGKLGPDLDRGGTVHFARFVVVGHNLVMASSYDGYFEDYIQMFIHTMGDTFDDLMQFVANPAPTPVREHPGAFVDWVNRHDIAPIGFYSGYEDKSVQQIRSALDMPSFAGKGQPGKPTLAPNPTPIPADQIADIQGLILRGFGQPVAVHVVASVADAATARQLLATLADPSDSDSLTVTAGTEWGDDRPDYCLALGITAMGLVALGVPDEHVATFPSEFLDGAVKRAGKVGDWGASSPSRWADGYRDAESAHVLFSLYAADPAALDARTEQLLAMLDGSMHVLSQRDAAVFAEDKTEVHFGYKDGISQPIIAGDPVLRPADHQPAAAAGEFVLGYESQYAGVTLDIPTPHELGLNGSFTAFRLLDQDVAAFEDFLTDQGTKTGLGTEKLAAKLVGRWRNGVPIVLSPDTDSPEPAIPKDQWNNFGYKDEDGDGLKCPIGSHMRRSNPRDQPMVPVGDGEARRIMRRGMPYGPRWSAGDKPDKVERGLAGHFIGASLVLQFETVMGEWLNQGMTKPEITGTNDVLLGVGMPHARCPIPTAAADGTVDADGITITGFPQFTRTRGCVYAFLPSMTALRWLGAMDTAPAVTAELSEHQSA